MMKKMYETPEMEMIEIEVTGMLCGSTGGNVFDEDTEDIGGEGDPGAVAE